MFETYRKTFSFFCETKNYVSQYKERLCAKVRSLAVELCAYYHSEGHMSCCCYL